MAKNVNTHNSQSGTQRRSGGKRASWLRKSEAGFKKYVIIMAVAGVIAALGCWFLQSSILSPASVGKAMESSPVRINELMSDNSMSLVTPEGDVPDWVEIINTGSEAVDLSSYALLLDIDFGGMYAFPETVLEPGACMLVYCDGQGVGQYSAPFTLSPSGGQTLSLINAKGQTIDAVTLPELKTDSSYCRNTDGSWEIGRSTPGVDNAYTGVLQTGVKLESGEVEISEVMSSNSLYFPDENGRKHDYVELHNVSGAAVDLSGWYLSDSGDNLKRWAFPAVTLPADGYLAVHCSGLDRVSNSHLHTDFKIGAGESVYLSRPDGHTVSMVDVPELEQDQAYSLVDGAWTVNLAPTPGLPNNAEAAAQAHGYTMGDLRASLYISEIMTSPTDQDYDWIELYNGSNQTIDLSGFGLSDNSARPRKWQFPTGSYIAPGQYMGIYCSGLSDAMLGGYLNADFGLSSDGCTTVTLSTAAGQILDAIYMPKQYTGVSYGRMDGMMGAFYLETPTPGSANVGAAYRERAAMAVPSVEGGLFRSGESFYVELSAPAGSRIYYTLDCTDPNEGSTLYTGPIPVSGTTILRSRVYRDGCMTSFTDTQSYLFDAEGAAGAYIISLVSDPANLYGSHGILDQYEELWEVEASFELFTDTGERVLGQGCGISLHGQDSRKLDVKTFNVIGRGQYSPTNRFAYPIFEDRPYEEYQSFLLRASGEDYDMSFMRDTALSTLMEGTSVLYQEYEVAVIYLNGAYYSLTYLRERMNDQAICQFEGWDGMHSQLDIVKGNSGTRQGSNDSYKKLLEYLKNNDCTTAEAYDYIDSVIDIQNYIEYMSLQIFTGNTDTLNVKRYRNPLDDGKWRWILFDLDWAFYTDTDSIRRWLTPGGAGASNATDNTLFIGCMLNPTFREQFLTYFGEQMATTFSPQNVMDVINENYSRIENLLPRYKQEYGFTLEGGTRKFLNYAKTRADKLVNEYFPEAMNLSDADMEKYFGEAMRKIEEFNRENGLE